jgi:hypothetical protein
MGTPITFDVAAFRLAYPEYANTPPTDATLQAYFNTASAYINPYSGVNWCNPIIGMNLAQQTLALNLLTAHLAYISGLIAQGQVPGLMQNATIDKVSVGLTPPPLKTQFMWWLSVSPYGQQLAALLQVASVGGTYIGGLPERAAFRRVLGGFGPGCCGGSFGRVF